MCVAAMYFYPAEALAMDSFNCFDDCGQYCGGEYLDDEVGLERVFSTPCNASAPSSDIYSLYSGGCDTYATA